MSFLSSKNQESTQESASAPEPRWNPLLADIQDERLMALPLWKRVLIFWAWAGGFAGAAALAVVILVGIAELFSADRVFTARVLSDWMFWASAGLMLFGLVSPTSSELQKQSADKNKKKKKDQEPQEDRATRSIRRRLRRAYDPWRWRLWGAALLTFGLSALIGTLA
jgi:hypothetical protein